MTTVSQTFNSSRFGSFLRCYIGENRRSMLIFFAVVLLLPTILVCLEAVTNLDDYDRAYNHLADADYDPQRSMIEFTLFFLAGIFTAYSGSLVFSTLATPKSRTAFLTIPASQLEKYTAAILVYVVGFIVAMIFSVNLANVVRVVIFGTVSEYLKLIPINELFFYFGEDMEYPNLMCVSMWVLFISLIATFTLGSSLWPRHGFLLTIVALIVLQIVLMICGVAGFYHLTIYVSKSSSEEIAIMTLVTLGVLYSLFCFTIAYFRMKEWEYIDRW